MGRACVVGAGGAVGAPAGGAPAVGAPAGGAPAGGAPAGGAACSGGKGWAANMPNDPSRGKAKLLKKRNNEYRGWGGRG